MNTVGNFRRLMSLLLAAALFLSFPLPARATELTDPTEQTFPEETAAAETIPVETEPAETAPVEPPPTEAVPKESLPTEETTVPTEETTAPTEESTAPTEEATEPEITEPTEETTVPEETLPDGKPVQILTVAQVLGMLPGTRGLTLRGVVVYADRWQAVVQDETGGIRLSFGEEPCLTVGEYIQVTGRRTEGMAAEDFLTLGFKELPVVACTMEEAPENHRVSITSAYLKEDLLSQNGSVLTLAGKNGPEGWVNVTGVLLDGVLHADSLTPGEAPKETPSKPEPHFSCLPRFGLLHGHSGPNGIQNPPEQVFSMAAGMADMDFFALTDVSDTLDNRESGGIGEDGSISKNWAAGKLAAQNATNSGFLALFGFEMAWPANIRVGHIVTLNTPGWEYFEKENKTGPESLAEYLENLSAAPEGVSMFCHPNPQTGEFYRFSNYDPGHDSHMHLLELGSGVNMRTYYNMALRKGWHVAPACPAPDWEELQSGSSPRTVVLTESLTEESLYQAISQYRVYATEDSDLEIYYALNGSLMGSTVGETRELWAEIWVKDPTDTGRVTIQVFTEATDPVGIHSLSAAEDYLKFRVADEHAYYYLVIEQEDGDIAVTAPVWVDDYEQMGVASFGTETRDPVEGMEIELKLALYNDEPVDYRLESVEFYRKVGEKPEVEEQDILLRTTADANVVYAGNTLQFTCPYRQEESGETVILAVIKGYVNGKYREYRQTLLLIYLETEPKLLPIDQVRRGVLNQAYRIEGYVTAGNQNIYNCFTEPDTIYVQDDTGGIAVTGKLPDLSTRQRVSLKGVLQEDQYGNRSLSLLSCEPGEVYYPYEPEEMDCKQASDYDKNGGKLVKVTGTVISLDKTFDKKGISRLTLRDSKGNQVPVLIESSITSGAYGTNTLAGKIKKGRTVEAIGLVHIDTMGQTVVRVRNCDEVSYIAPIADPSNPKTGDSLWHWLDWLLKLFWT